MHKLKKQSTEIQAHPTNCSTSCVGSRSYSDHVDTWADSVCIHQLVLEPCSETA